MDRLDWAAWRDLSAVARTDLVARVASAVGGVVEERSEGPCVRLRGRSLVLVPGGTVELGWDGRPVALTDAQRRDWMADPADDTFEDFLRDYLGRQRRVTLAPILVELAAQPVSELVGENVADPEAAVHDAIAAEGFRLLASDEWENAARGGATTMFRWGDSWPDGVPYAGETAFTAHTLPGPLGLRWLSDPYQIEVVADGACARGGDGGAAICGGRPAAETWYSFALAFEYPRVAWDDVVVEIYEGAHVRRALSL